MSTKGDIWAKQSAMAEAREEIAMFKEKTDGEANYIFACHAAVPEILTPELLYLIRDNFKRDSNGHPLQIPWMAVSDLLLSDLCREIGFETFEIKPYVRQVLYQQLERDARFGQKRLVELSDFLMAYIRPLLQHQSPAQRREARRQRWVALSIVSPESAAQEVATAYQDYYENGQKAGQNYIRRFLEKVPTRSTQMAVLERYVTGTYALSKGHNDKAEEILRPLGSSLQFGEFQLLIPQVEEDPIEIEEPSVEEELLESAEGRGRVSSISALTEVIRPLGIQSLGSYDLVNLGRKAQLEMFWDFFDQQQATSNSPCQFLFVPGNYRQLPTTFVERVAYELSMERLEEDYYSLFYRTDPRDNRPRTFALPQARNLERSQRAFVKFLTEFFNIPSHEDLEQFLKTGLANLEYKYIFLPFRFNQIRSRDFIFDFFRWVMEDLFGDLGSQGQEMPSILFSFVIDMEDEHSRTARQFLAILSELVDRPNATIIRIFDPISKEDLLDWLNNLGVTNSSSIDQLIQVFVRTLPPEAQQLYTTSAQFDMDTISRLQDHIFKLSME